MTRIILVFLFFLQFSFSQKLETKVFFSENEDYVLIDYNENIIYYEFDEVKKCSYDSYLSIIGKNEHYNLLAHKDSIYFEFHGDRKTTKNIDSVFCINNSLQYKNKDTSFHATYIFDKMSKESFYKKYGLNQAGKLINNEIKYKIDNIRDTIFYYSPDSDIIKPYKIDAKVFTLTFYHKERILKKINPGFLFLIYQFGEDLIDYNRMNEEFSKDFETFMRDFKKELDLCINNKSEHNKIVDFKIFNHQNKYYFDMDYKDLQDKFLILTDRFYLSKAFEKGKLKPKIYNSYSPTTWDPYSDCSFDDFFILD